MKGAEGKLLASKLVDLELFGMLGVRLYPLVLNGVLPNVIIEDSSSL